MLGSNRIAAGNIRARSLPVLNSFPSVGMPFWQVAVMFGWREGETIGATASLTHAHTHTQSRLSLHPRGIREKSHSLSKVLLDFSFGKIFGGFIQNGTPIIGGSGIP